MHAEANRCMSYFSSDTKISNEQKVEMQRFLESRDLLRQIVSRFVILIFVSITQEILNFESTIESEIQNYP